MIIARHSTSVRPGHRGSILIIVLWMAFGLVSLALYFAQAMTFELRAADNRMASAVAEEAIDGAAVYVSNLLANVEYPGEYPDPLAYETEAVPLGDATFWLIGRDTNTWQTGRPEPTFALDDESAKLNLNTATADMLEFLPGMTPALAAAIVDWRDTDSDLTVNGAEDETYQRLDPPYRCKNADFDSLDELRLVAGMTPEILYGEDANLNGVLDPNENDGDASPPLDNRDGRLDAGVLEYLTVWSGESSTSRTNVNEPDQLAKLLQDALGADRANQVVLGLGGNPGQEAGAGRPGGGRPGSGRPGRRGSRHLWKYARILHSQRPHRRGIHARGDQSHRPDQLLHSGPHQRQHRQRNGPRLHPRHRNRQSGRPCRRTTGK